MAVSKKLNLVVRHGSSLQEKIACVGCTNSDYSALKGAFQGKEVAVLGYNEKFVYDPASAIVSGSETVKMKKQTVTLTRDTKAPVVISMLFPDDSAKATLFANAIKNKNVGGAKVLFVSRRSAESL